MNIAEKSIRTNVYAHIDESSCAPDTREGLFIEMFLLLTDVPPR